ncbi:hypothetical protein NLI96_g5906 [Meripilus lineatus]|uniref:MFS general substrate transporter n=1 Tax=Meripilus lineatus TaxID=2056292 RepID=A0AAD5V1Z9_9APHY|nr:hypothetical protein NLI96_g5906 [Physisporinus lineatus]
MHGQHSVMDDTTDVKDPVVVEHVEDRSSSSYVDNLDSTLLDTSLRAQAERKLVRKLDWRLLPTIILIFIMNYIDRTAVTAARLKGLQQDLRLTDIQYSTVLAVLYASYVPAQIPSNMVTQSYSGILAARIFVGLPEELAFRSALLYGGLLISNAFGSVGTASRTPLFSPSHLTLKVDGRRNIVSHGGETRNKGVEMGAITICIGFIAVFLLPDYPHNTRWLSPAQRRLAQVRLAEDAGEADEDSSEESAFTGLKLAIKDPKVSIFAVMTCSQLLGLSFVNFFPTLTATLGFSTTISLLLAAPPWIWATIVCSLNAWNAGRVKVWLFMTHLLTTLHQDRTGERFFHIALWWWGVILGYIIGVSTMSVGGRYVAMFLMASGYAGFALTLVWVSNAIPRPPAKRSASIGIVNGFGNLGNLIGSYAWKSDWGPDYHPSMYIGLASLAFATLLAFVIRCILVHQNAQLAKDEFANLKGAERERIEEAARLEGLTFEEALERKKGFRYLY